MNAMTASGLVRLNSDFELEPDWAESWEPLEDRDGWRFRIRVNQHGWDDDVPVTAYDFAAAWRSLLDPANASRSAWLLFDIENAREYFSGMTSAGDLGIAAIDDWTLEVYLDRPRVSFPLVAASPELTALSGPVEAVDADDGCWVNGPFHPVEHDEGTLSLLPNQRYWNSAGSALDRIEMSAMSSSQAITEFRQSRLDLMLLTGADVTRARDDALISDAVVRGMPVRAVMLIPNVDVPPFNSVEVRRALSSMIDRRRLETIVEGRVIPSTRLFPPGMFLELDDATGGLDARFDVDAALDEIAAAPISDPREWEPFGLDVPVNDTFLDRIARDVTSQLRENLGIQVPIRIHDPEEYALGLREQRFPLAWIDWTYRYADPACGYSDLFGSWRNPDRPLAWTDSDYDDLVRAADTLGGASERANAYAGCEGLLQEQGVYIPLVHPVSYYLAQPWLDGLPFDSRNRLISGETFGIDISRGVIVRDWPE